MAQEGARQARIGSRIRVALHERGEKRIHIPASRVERLAEGLQKFPRRLLLGLVIPPEMIRHVDRHSPAQPSAVESRRNEHEQPLELARDLAVLASSEGERRFEPSLRVSVRRGLSGQGVDLDHGRRDPARLHAARIFPWGRAPHRVHRGTERMRPCTERFERVVEGLPGPHRFERLEEREELEHVPSARRFVGDYFFQGVHEGGCQGRVARGAHARHRPRLSFRQAPERSREGTRCVCAAGKRHVVARGLEEGLFEERRGLRLRASHHLEHRPHATRVGVAYGRLGLASRSRRRVASA